MVTLKEVVFLSISLFIICVTMFFGFKRYGYKKSWWIFSFPAGIGFFMIVGFVIGSVPGIYEVVDNLNNKLIHMRFGL